MSAGEALARMERIAETAPRCVWLDGGAAEGWGGRSTLAWLEGDDVSLSYDAARREVTRHRGGRAEVVGDDVFAVLAAEVAATPAAPWFGYLGYGCRTDLAADPDPRLPDAVWLRPSHVERAPGGRVAAASVRVPPLEPPAWYPEAFARVQERLRAGDSYEVNLTYRVDAESPIDPLPAYRRLREISPAPYAGFLQHDMAGARAWLLSSSMETYARVADGWIETRPIKGTTPRGATPQDDERLRASLASDPRFRAENLMILDLLRNDVSMVCEPGTVTVPRLMEVESYAAVHQLVSTVRGRLRTGGDGVGVVAAVRALFPAGSMTGAPKLRTMQIIDAVEAGPRGVYAGAFGTIDGSGADLAVVIRSLTTAGDGRWQVGTGGGVTVRSRMEEEAAESGWKVARLLTALDMPETGQAG